HGRAHGRQVIPRELVDAMMTDQVSAEVKAASPFVPGFWQRRGWGYGVSLLHAATPGEPRGCGWDGGYGTCAYWDPETQVTVILLSQRLVEGPVYSQIYHDFFSSAYAAAGL